MKKILSSCLFALLFILLAFYSHPSTTYAYNNCVCDTPNRTGDGNNHFTCSDGVKGACTSRDYVCVNQTVPDRYVTSLITILQGTRQSYPYDTPYGITCTTQQKPVVEGCSCVNAYSTAQYQNGISCPGYSGLYCNSGGEACIPDPNAISTIDRISDKYIKGVYCSVDARATSCTCENPNDSSSGKNGFWCNYNGGTRNVHAYCDHVGLACSQQTGNVVNNVDWNVGPDDGQAAQGISCGIPKATDCACDPNQRPKSAQNGFSCNFNGQKKHGWCSSSSLICMSAPGNVYTTQGGDFTERVDAIGIKCGEKVVQPAVPPCAPGGMVNGKCTKIVSSVGEIGTDPASFITKLFGVLLAASGAIGLILMMRAGYKIMTARGNAEGIQHGREQLVAAIIGLMFLIFSFVILQVIGVDLLQLPGSGVTGSGTGGSGTTSCTVGMGGGQGTCSTGQTCVSNTGSACSGGTCAGTCQ